MDHRDRHQNDDWRRGGDDWRRSREHGEEGRRDDGRGRDYRPAEPANFDGGDAYQRPSWGDSTYATGRLSSTSGYGPQATGQGGHMRSHEGDFGYANVSEGGRSQGYGDNNENRGRQSYAGSDYSGQGYGGERGRDRDDYGQGRQASGGYGQGRSAYGYPDSRSTGGQQYGGDYGRGGQRQARGGGRPDQQPFGPGQGFGQGGAYQAGWGGQRDDDDRHEHHGRDRDERGRGGGTYGQRDFDQSARRSEYRSDQHGGGRDEPYGRDNDRRPDLWEAGYSGYVVQDRARDDHDHEPDYRHWRESRLAEMDREHHERREKQSREWDEHYGKYREERRNSFGRAFEDWRQKLANTVDNVKDAVTGDDDDRDANRLATDRTDAGARSPGVSTTPDGGAGMRGAGAVGGSSATMASGSAGTGAPNPSTGASTAGVTKGSENKTDKPH